MAAVACFYTWEKVTDGMGEDREWNAEKFQGYLDKENAIRAFQEAEEGERDLAALDESLEFVMPELPCDGPAAMGEVLAAVNEKSSEVDQRTADFKEKHQAYKAKAQSISAESAGEALRQATADVEGRMNKVNENVLEAFKPQPISKLLAKFRKGMSTKNMGDAEMRRNHAEIRAEVLEKRAEVSFETAKSLGKIIHGSKVASHESVQGQSMLADPDSGDSTADGSEAPTTPSGQTEAVDQHPIYELMLEGNDLSSDYGIYKKDSEFAVQKQKEGEKMLSQHEQSREKLEGCIEEKRTVVTARNRHRMKCEETLYKLLGQVSLVFDEVLDVQKQELFEEECLARYENLARSMDADIAQMKMNLKKVTKGADILQRNCSTYREEVIESCKAAMSDAVAMHQESCVEMAKAVGIAAGLNEKSKNFVHSHAEKVEAEEQAIADEIAELGEDDPDVCISMEKLVNCQERTAKFVKTKQEIKDVERHQEDIFENIKLGASANEEVYEAVLAAYEAAKDVSHYFPKEDSSTALAKRTAAQDKADEEKKRLDALKLQQDYDKKEALRLQREQKGQELEASAQ